MLNIHQPKQDEIKNVEAPDTLLTKLNQILNKMWNEQNQFIQNELKLTY